MRYSTITKHHESQSLMFRTRGLMVVAEDETMSVNGTRPTNNIGSGSAQRKATVGVCKQGNVTTTAKKSPSSESRKHTGKRRMEGDFESRAAPDEDDTVVRRSLSHDERHVIEENEESRQHSPPSPPRARVSSAALASFLPRHESTDINRQGSFQDLALPFSQHNAQNAVENENAVLLRHIFQNTSHNPSLLSTRNSTWEFASPQFQAPANTMISTATATERKHFPFKPRAQAPSILPRSKEPSRPTWPTQDSTPTPRCSFSGICDALAEQYSKAEQQDSIQRDQAIFRSPLQIEEGEMSVDQDRPPQETPKDCLEPRLYTSVSQHEQTAADGVSACLAPRPTGACTAFGQRSSFLPFHHEASQFQTPAQLQSMVPFSAWGSNPMKGPLANLSFPALGLDGDNERANGSFEMRDCDILGAFGPRSTDNNVGQPASFLELATNQTDRNHRREDAESICSSSSFQCEGKQMMWSLDSAMKSSHSGSLLGTP